MGYSNFQDRNPKAVLLSLELQQEICSHCSWLLFLSVCKSEPWHIILLSPELAITAGLKQSWFSMPLYPALLDPSWSLFHCYGSKPCTLNMIDKHSTMEQHLQPLSPFFTLRQNLTESPKVVWNLLFSQIRLKLSTLPPQPPKKLGWQACVCQQICITVLFWLTFPNSFSFLFWLRKYMWSYFYRRPNLEFRSIQSIQWLVPFSLPYPPFQNWQVSTLCRVSFQTTRMKTWMSLSGRCKKIT